MVVKIITWGCCCAAGVLWIATVSAAPADLLLADAVKNRDTVAVRELLRNPTNVNAPQQDGTTALHWAAHWNDIETATLLIGAGANVNAATDFGITPIILACTNGNVAMVEALLKAGANAKLARESGETPVMTCSRTGNVDAVKALLARGVDVNAKENVQGQTALMWAASQNQAEIALLLIDRGADVRARTTKAGFTPLLFAARQGARDAIQVLLAKGADVNAVASDGTSVLMAATYTGHWDLAKSLLDRGADPNLAGAGYTALHWMSGSWEGHFTGIVGTDKFQWIGARGPGKLELVQALLAHGADPNARLEKRPPLFGFGGGWFRANYTGATPFMLAAVGGNVSVMRALLAAGADPLLTAKDGTTALMAAAGYGRVHGESRVTDDEAVEAVKIAVEVGIPVNATNQSGQTALHGAAYFQTDPVVQLLLDKGANVNTRNVSGETPLTIAYGYDSGGGIFYSESTAELLRKAGGIEVMEFSGVLKSVETPCPTPTLLITVPQGFGISAEYGGNTSRLVTFATTQYVDGVCTDLKPGMKIGVAATRLVHRLDKNGQSWNCSLDASRIQIDPK
jgi:ankyrin repeat protein